MRSAGAVENALLDKKYGIAKGVAIQYRTADATAGAGAGHEQAVDVLAHQVGNQVRAEECAGSGLADDKFAFFGLDHVFVVGTRALLQRTVFLS